MTYHECVLRDIPSPTQKTLKPVFLSSNEREREIDKDVEEGKECEKEREGQSMSNRKGKKWGETVCQAALQAQPIAKHEVGMA